MTLVIPDADLMQLVASQVLLAQAWPVGWDDVMLMVHVLRTSFPSLADVLTLGLITLLGPLAEAVTAQVLLSYKAVTLTALAGGDDGDKVPEPYRHPAAVTRLEITDLRVGGRSGLRLAGGDA